MFYGTICLITNEKGEILLLKRSLNKKLFPGTWAIVSAGPYKSVNEAKSHIKEEIFLETGLNAEKLREKDILKTSLRGDRWEIYPFSTSVNSKQPIILNDEHTEYRWVNKNELKNYDFPPGIATAMKTFFSTP